MYKRGIIALACLQFLLQTYIIFATGLWTSPSPLVAQPLSSFALLATSAAIDAGIVRYVLQSVDRTTQAYALEMNAELEHMLARYQDETAKTRQRARDVALAVEQELARAREALAVRDFAGTSGHLKEGLNRTLVTAPPPCDNPVITAVITGKAQECQGTGITLSAHCRVAHDLPLPDTDVAAIVFNLIDNACHECAALLAEGALENPTVAVRITAQSGQLLIEVENPCRAGEELARRVRRHPTLPRGPHGLGTGIISSLAKQHGGIAEFNVRDGLFIAQVMLSLEHNESHEEGSSCVR